MTHPARLGATADATPSPLLVPGFLPEANLQALPCITTTRLGGNDSSLCEGVRVVRLVQPARLELSLLDPQQNGEHSRRSHHS